MERKVRFSCRGRGFEGEEVLRAPVQPVARLVKLRRGEAPVEVSVTCPHNAGSHGERCRAAHRGKDKVDEGILCPFSFDFPYVRELDRKWQVPAELKESMRALLGKDV